MTRLTMPQGKQQQIAAHSAVFPRRPPRSAPWASLFSFRTKGFHQLALRANRGEIDHRGIGSAGVGRFRRVKIGDGGSDAAVIPLSPHW
ncbi:hypothetical protein HPP92_012155 [Vanilla planifolia]|uniref:Uncharacterized protein n=1 Tax=Vanilla planifolia TaxID=51239 RepID=A0A835V0V7_VANPL|nr:hypothetical protein HPP92_012155 [Vanilla planifolia]